MDRTTAELKRLAREKLVGHWGLVIGAMLLLALLTFAALLPFEFLFFITGGGMVQFFTYLVAAMIISVISIIFKCGIIRMMLSFAKGQGAEIGMMFGEFTKRPDRYIIAALMLVGIEVLCALPGSLCWIVGLAQGSTLASGIGLALSLAGGVITILVGLRFNLVFILLVDDPQMGAVGAFRESSRLMDGNKGRMFYLYLSFLGLMFLCICSCGLGMVWVTPYMNQTIISFYLDVSGELDKMQGAGTDMDVVFPE